MKCEKYTEIISAFVDSEASPLEQLALQKHLEVCEKCKRELVVQYKMKNMVQSEHSMDSFGDIHLSSAVMQKIKTLSVEPVHYRSFSRASRLSAVAVILLAMLVTIFYTYNDRKNAALSISSPYTGYIYTHVNEEAEMNGEVAQNVQDYIEIPDRRISTVSLNR
ncbi:MAG: zf-HC2 domain-containing protein [Deferribacteraceae bacterium]|jgi:anti-sigma factor RsiW|nr:zf-HC2 domain-containing protein [Deferribacteraceae bacterium]